MHGCETEAAFALPCTVERIVQLVQNGVLNPHDFSYTGIVINPRAIYQGDRKFFVTGWGEWFDLNRGWTGESPFSRLDMLSTLRSDILDVIYAEIRDGNHSTDPLICDHHCIYRPQIIRPYVDSDAGTATHSSNLPGFYPVACQGIKVLLERNMALGSFRISSLSTLANYLQQCGLGAFIFETPTFWASKRKAASQHATMDVALVQDPAVHRAFSSLLSSGTPLYPFFFLPSKAQNTILQSPYSQSPFTSISSEALQYQGR